MFHIDSLMFQFSEKNKGFSMFKLTYDTFYDFEH